MPEFSVLTDYPVALSSLDHLHPYGTKRDNHRNQDFNQQLYSLFAGRVAVLDLGCAGGGFVKNCIEDGHLGIGLEGSDFSWRHRRAEWNTIPGCLFLCDITRPFIVHTGDRLSYLFDVITAWDVLEHIKKQDLPGLFENVLKHMRTSGLFFASIANKPSIVPRTIPLVDLHLIHEDLDWWTRCLEKNGLVRDKSVERHFSGRWLRTGRRTYYVAARHHEHS